MKKLKPNTNVPSFAGAQTQVKLLEKIAIYYSLKQQKMPYNSSSGLCNGLVIYWLYCKRSGIAARWFDKDFAYALNWDRRQFDIEKMQDPKMEHFLHAVMPLQHDHQLRHGITQEDLPNSLELILPDEYPQLAAAEFSTTFVFDYTALANILPLLALPNKMLRIVNSFHAVALININGEYNFYNPTSTEVKLDSAADAAQAILESLELFCESGNYVALNINVYDLADAALGSYPDMQAYYKKLLQDQEYKAAVLANDYIFHLASRSNDIIMMDYLFNIGYIYAPCNKLPLSEVGEAVVYLRPKLLDYLLSKGLSPYNPPGNQHLTYIGHCILRDSLELVCILLAAGINPNDEVFSGYSILQCAIEQENPHIVAVVLGAGADFTFEAQESLLVNFEPAVVKEILTAATQINSHLLQVEDDFALDNASAQQIINILQHLKFRLSVGADIDQLTLKYKNKFYVGANALKQIASYYKKLSEDNLVSLLDKTKIHDLLESLAVKKFNYRDFRELLHIFDKITKLVLNKPNITDHSILDLQEIAIILRTLNAFILAHKRGNFFDAETRAIDRAQKTISKLQHYLQSNQISNLDEYIKTRVPDSKKLRSSLYFTKTIDELAPLAYYNEVAKILAKPTI